MRDVHVPEQLPELVEGELDLEDSRAVTDHLRRCPECRDELVEVAAGIGLMRRLDTLASTEPPVAAPKSRSWISLAAAAAVMLVLAGVTAATLLLIGSGDDQPSARVDLAPIADADARGSVAMREVGAAQAMEVETSLRDAPRNAYYEVWLLDRDSGRVLPVGVLPPDGKGTYRLPNELLGRYDTVDISVQADDGSTAHSNDSVLRAEYS
jgi:anti-sigma factor RsiW